MQEQTSLEVQERKQLILTGGAEIDFREEVTFVLGLERNYFGSGFLGGINKVTEVRST